MNRPKSLGLLGKYEEGKRAVENLLKLKPDFQSHGLVLIKRYIKFENIVERVIEGLNKVGLEIKQLLTIFLFNILLKYTVF